MYISRASPRMVAYDIRFIYEFSVILILSWENGIDTELRNWASSTIIAKNSTTNESNI